jgi:ATP-binding cassette subfamily B (MDR/TAP) protein 1
VPQRVGIRQGLVNGLAVGGVPLVVFTTYAIALYYGAWRISTGAYTGGDVINVMVAALLGGFSLGQVYRVACACSMAVAAHQIRAAGLRQIVMR